MKPLLLLLPWVLAGGSTFAAFATYGRLLGERRRSVQAQKKAAKEEVAAVLAVGRAMQALADAAIDPDTTAFSRNRLEIARHEIERGTRET